MAEPRSFCQPDRGAGSPAGPTLENEFERELNHASFRTPVMRPILAPADKVVFGFDRFTAFSRLKNSERNCSCIPSRSGNGKILNNARFVFTELAPSSALRHSLSSTLAPMAPPAVQNTEITMNQKRRKNK